MTIIPQFSYRELEEPSEDELDRLSYVGNATLLRSIGHKCQVMIAESAKLHRLQAVDPDEPHIGSGYYTHEQAAEGQRRYRDAKARDYRRTLKVLAMRGPTKELAASYTLTYLIHLAEAAPLKAEELQSWETSPSYGYDLVGLANEIWLGIRPKAPAH